MTFIYLLRHGRTVSNEQGDRFCGTSDVELTQKGIQQAIQAAEKLKEIPLDAIYHTGLIRSKQTAREILLRQEASGYGPIFEQASELREVGFGVWEGLTKKEVHLQYGELYETWVKRPTQAPIPNGEDLIAAQTRAYQKLQELSANHQGQKIAIVAHNTINRLLMMAIMQAPINHYRKIIQSNACINIFEWIDGSNFILHGINLT